jgi:hypothetical protein
VAGGRRGFIPASGHASVAAMTTTLTGGCQCGRIRYEAALDSDEAYLCHCGMCRKATGGVSIAFVNLPKAAVTWTTQAPEQYRSSPIAYRGFCVTCGTPLTFAFPDSDKMDLTVGSFDNPSWFVPRHHFSIETRLEPWVDTSHLPGYRLDEHANVVERWKKAIGEYPG